MLSSNTFVISYVGTQRTLGKLPFYEKQYVSVVNYNADSYCYEASCLV